MITNYNKSKETPMGDENKHKTVYSLKVTPRGDETIENLSCYLSILKNKNFPFGEFNNYILIHGVEPEWAVLEFFPYSKDVHIFASEYKTYEQALDAAIKHLNESGLDVTPFDLEKLVNKVKIKTRFKTDKGLFVDYS